MFTFPRKWSREELQRDRDKAEALFRTARQNEGPKVFYEHYKAVEPSVRAVLADTKDLRKFDGSIFLKDPLVWHVLRYFCAPPISEEDLWTLVGRKFKHVGADFADDTAEAISVVLDAVRLPWLSEKREPTAAEREAAVKSTTCLLAHERLKTLRRGNASKVQEDEVVETLAGIGLVQDDDRTPILVLDRLERGHFSRERKVAGAKCDVPVRLADGRLLALECKVSNGPKNSWKRLHREAGGKSEQWAKEFGSQVVTGAVLAGVYDLSCVLSSQEQHHVYIFWQHDLTSLREFAEAAK
jgi:hypothetical protein